MGATRPDLATVRGLRERCSLYRVELADRGVPRDLLKAHWPGGAENRSGGLAGWVFCYGSYRTLLDGGSLDGAPEERDERERAARQAAMAALRTEPVVVELVERAADGSPQRLAIHPKGYDALVHIQRRDQDLLRLARAYQRLVLSEKFAQRETAALILDEISYQQRILVWILSTPGPRLPFDPYQSPQPDLPDSTKDLHSLDFLEVVKAHRIVNGQRASLIVAQLNAMAQPGTTSAGFETVAAQAAKVLGVSAPSLLRDWSLESWLAQLALTAPASGAVTGEDLAGDEGDP